MRSSIKYEIDREDDYDFKLDKPVNRVKFRSAGIEVFGKTPEEAEKIFESLESFIQNNNDTGFNFSFSHCSKLTDKDEKSGNYFYYDYIPVTDKMEFDIIKKLYQKWKLLQK